MGSVMDYLNDYEKKLSNPVIEKKVVVQKVLKESNIQSAKISGFSCGHCNYKNSSLNNPKFCPSCGERSVVNPLKESKVVLKDTKKVYKDSVSYANMILDENADTSDSPFSKLLTKKEPTEKQKLAAIEKANMLMEDDTPQPMSIPAPDFSQLKKRFGIVDESPKNNFEVLQVPQLNEQEIENQLRKAGIV